MGDLLCSTGTALVLSQAAHSCYATCSSQDHLQLVAALLNGIKGCGLGQRALQVLPVRASIAFLVRACACTCGQVVIADQLDHRLHEPDMVVIEVFQKRVEGTEW